MVHGDMHFHLCNMSITLTKEMAVNILTNEEFQGHIVADELGLI